MFSELVNLLAPGDARALSLDGSRFEWRVVESPDDPAFEAAYAALWREFGPVAELESPAVLAHRLAWDPARAERGLHLLYRMVLLTSEGRFVAVRDHTAILPVGARACTVHLSHLLVAPEFRRTGVAGAMRAIPLLTARDCMNRAGADPALPVTLVAQMEHADPLHPARMRRLIAYSKAGYRKPDPLRVPYLQPDFRDPAEIDATGGPVPLPFSLILRRVGREAETEIGGDELRAIVRALYGMYALGFREADMAPVWQNLNRFPDGSERIALLPPDAVGPAA